MIDFTIHSAIFATLLQTIDSSCIRNRRMLGADTVDASRVPALRRTRNCRRCSTSHRAKLVRDAHVLEIADKPSDVTVLYQIVRSAEQYTDVETLPFRAIFAAYERILPENGLDPNHDQIYLRFLFRLGDRRTEGQSLYQSFEALLEELGFEIQIVADEDGALDITTNIDTLAGQRGVNALVRSPGKPLKNSRRASLDSGLGTYDPISEAAPVRPTSRASMSRLDVSQRFIMDTRPSTRATTRKTEKTDNFLSPLRITTERSRGDRLTAEAFPSSLRNTAERRHFLSGEEGRRDLASAITEHTMVASASPPRRHSDLVNPPSDGSMTSPTNYLILSPGPAYSLRQRERLYNPSRTQMLRDAETFHHYRIRSVARQIVDKWCYAALEANDHHKHLERLAAARDAEILLRQAFENWRARLHAKKQAAEVERYFKLQERKVQRSRNLMLMDKAFSHWSQCVSEERSRTKNARQHVLALKYLRAWRDITVKNQGTIRQQVIRKFFNRWKQGCIQRLTENLRADFIRRESLCRNAYWSWFWAFCERRAPEWRASRLKAKYFSLLIAIASKRERQIQYATMHSAILHRARVLSQWIPKARVALDNQEKALLLNDRNQTLHTLRIWRRNQQYAAPQRQISNMVDWRVAGATFAIFATRFQCEQQAAAINRLRIVRNAWTAWNDRLRWHTIAHRIDDRYCLEALYRWVIAARCLLLQRLREERLKQHGLRKLHSVYASNISLRARSAQIIEDTRRRRHMRSCLATWHARLDSLRNDEWMALEFSSPKILQNAVHLWMQRARDIAQTGSWINDAQFYLVGKKMVKRWRAATAEAKRQKRKSAYIQIRRMVKMNLAASVLRRWLNLLSHHESLEQDADDADRNRLINFGTTLFDLWKSKTEMRRNQDIQATWHYSTRLIERFLYTWIEGCEEQTRLEQIAEFNYDMRVKEIASSCLNKLRLKIIKSKGQQAIAENLGIRYEKRRLHNLLRRWQDKQLHKLEPKHAQKRVQTTPYTARTRSGTAPRSTTIERAEEWTEFDIGDWVPALEAQASSTPGYLSTPSKRAARARALFSDSTTPAGTPFEQRLRPYKFLTPRSQRKGAFGRSVSALKGSTFEAIIEDSPRTPDVGMK